MSFTLDFWTVPDAYGVAGMFVGLAIGMPLLFFRIFPNAELGRVSHWDIVTLFLIACAAAGMLLGELVRAIWLGYLW